MITSTGVLEKRTDPLVVAFKQQHDSKQDILNRTSTLSLDKKDFSWTVLGALSNSTPGHPQYAVENDGLQFKHYTELSELSSQLEEAIKKEHNDLAAGFITQIKAKKTTVPSIDSGRTILVNEDEYSGGNVVRDFFGGMSSMLGSAILAVGSIFYGLGSLLTGNKTYYYGTLTFLKDMLCEFVCGLVKTVTAVIFPISMVHSKVTTGSCNLFKGKRMRALDSLEELCKETIGKSTSEASNPLVRA